MEKQYEIVDRDGKSFGIIGTPALKLKDGRVLNVGDMVFYYKNYMGGNIASSFICKPSDYEKGYLMGWAGRQPDSVFDDFNSYKVIPYTFATGELLSYLRANTGEYQLKEIKIKEMTVEEIERELGYRVKIVGGHSNE